MTVTTQIQRVPYLREQRKFPSENLNELVTQVDQAYIDIAQKVNSRTIGIYATNFPVITGDKWYLLGSNQAQQTLRQVYPLTSTAPINHGINFAEVSQFTPNCYGSFTDGTNWYGAIYASNVAIAGQISFYITSTQIVILSGAGAPTISNGSILIEWISQF